MSQSAKQKDPSMNNTTLLRARGSALMFFALAGLTAPLSAQDSKDKDSKDSKNQQELQKCDKPIGTLAVVEPQQQSLYALRRYQLESPVGLIRMMVQQSNCFVVVERGQAMQNMQQERALARSGEMQQDANMGGGQMKAADFILTPAVVFDNPNSGGVGGAVGGLLGHGVGAVGGGVKFKEAETSMLVADARTTVQVAAAQGKAKKTSFALGGFGWTGMGAIAGGGYSNTAEGKLIAASYLDNYNNIVTALKADPNLMGRADKFKGVGLAGDETKAGAVFAEGDVLSPKIDNVKLLAEPKDGAKVLAALKAADKLVYLGEEQDGYLKVQGSDAEGWVKKALVKK
jgi:Curli production assembly/transport component CsgG